MLGEAHTRWELKLEHLKRGFPQPYSSLQMTSALVNFCHLMKEPGPEPPAEPPSDSRSAETVREYLLYELLCVGVSCYLPIDTNNDLH